jgi:hypothetical protein
MFFFVFVQSAPMVNFTPLPVAEHSHRAGERHFGVALLELAIVLKNEVPHAIVLRAPQRRCIDFLLFPTTKCAAYKGKWS